MRVGHGFATFPFQPGDKLALGGVVMPAEQGAAGRGDADVVLLALCDALLGAAGLGSCESVFPSHHSDFRNATSRELLCLTRAQIAAQHYALGNADVSLWCSLSGLQPHIAAMRRNITQALLVPESFINIKISPEMALPRILTPQGVAAFTTVLIQNDR